MEWCKIWNLFPFPVNSKVIVSEVDSLQKPQHKWTKESDRNTCHTGRETVSFEHRTDHSLTAALSYKILYKTRQDKNAHQASRPSMHLGLNCLPGPTLLCHLPCVSIAVYASVSRKNATIGLFDGNSSWNDDNKNIISSSIFEVPQSGK